MTGGVTAPGSARSVSVRAAVVAFVVDVVLVLLFAGIGRRSDAESGAVVGVLRTAWPFLAGVVLGWVVALGWAAHPPLRVRDGVPVWVLTVAGGMLLRAATGAGTAFSFHSWGSAHSPMP